MLTNLILKNLILVEELQISFEKGFTVISGETGSGKTALIEALKWVLGAKADLSKIRSGADKAVIQASFDLTHRAGLASELKDFGFCLDVEEELIITREISLTGKAKAWINGQLTPLSVLEKIAPSLLDIIGQYAQVSLKSEKTQRHFVDLYGQLLPLIAFFDAAWKEEKALEKSLLEMEETHKKKDQEKERALFQLEKLKDALEIKQEEEALFEEHTRLAHFQDCMKNAGEVLLQLERALPQLKDSRESLKAISSYAGKVKEASQLLETACVEVEEALYLTTQFHAQLEYDPRKMAFLEEQLKTLHELKKKYGPDLSLAKKEAEETLLFFEHLEENIEHMTKELKQAKQKTKTYAELLTEKRKKAAKELSSTLSSMLERLNIKGGEVSINVSSAQRSYEGEDQVSFFLRANPGEPLAAVAVSSSGGELSRLLFCLKVALAEKNDSSSLIFDEIDANVGGKTASTIGEELALLGKNLQVLCITHFPQVARHADHHLLVSKEEKAGRTQTQVAFLSLEDRSKEYVRMLGGKENFLLKN